jgi:hypothetical protein
MRWLKSCSIAALLVVGCTTSPVSLPPSTVPSQRLTSIPHATPTLGMPATPTNRASASPTAIRSASQDHEQAARHQAIDAFYSVMTQSYTFRNSDGCNDSLRPNVLSDPQVFPLHAIAAGRPIPSGGDLIKIAWVYDRGSYAPDELRESPCRVSRWLLEGELQTIRIVELKPQKISAADHANGIQWVGSAEIAYIHRRRITQSPRPRPRGSPTTRPGNPPIGQFTAWHDSTVRLHLVLQNGSWERYDGRTPLQQASGRPYVCDIVC